MPNASTSRIPAPLSFAASQWFEGPDGQWSSFVVRAGIPEQSFRVLPSTVTSETLVPLTGACKNTTISNCSFSRGAESYKGKQNEGFQARDSGTWHELGIYQIAARDELGYNASGLYGLDSLGLMIANSGGPTLLNQVVAGVVNPRLWVGRLGMDVKPSNFSEFENPQGSLIQTLKEENYIPSLSYGYTAGAYYSQSAEKPNTYGSLIYGGYDQSRFVSNNITFPFDANDSRKSSLSIQSITSVDTANTTVSLLPDGPAYTLIDFAESQIWLPVSACDQFAKAFNLKYDNSTDLYLVDPATHTELIVRNPSITFGLGKTANPGERVVIQLPYSAFDQQATYPIYPNATSYFPIRRAYNDTQYTLGRTFFQEAYVRIDYERGNFSIHQALFPQTNDKQDIVAVLSPGFTPSNTAPQGPVPKSRGLSIGAIAGILVGGVAVAACFLFFVFWRVWQQGTRKKSKRGLGEDGYNRELPDQPKMETDGVECFEKDGVPFVEMPAHAFTDVRPHKGEPEELDGRNARTELSTIIELYEMDSNDVWSLVELYTESSLRNRAPPDWI